MFRITKTVAALATSAALLVSAPAFAAGPSVGVIDHDWSFEGPFGSFDQAELRRGWQVYMNVCANCHALEKVYFRNLGEPGGPEFSDDDVKAIAAMYPHQIPFTDDEGNTHDLDGNPLTRPATPADRILGPFANEAAARAANGGAYPLDLSLITKARVGYHGTFKQILEGGGGPEYVYSLLLGYDPEPEGFDTLGLAYNRYFSGYRIAMYEPLYDGAVFNDNGDSLYFDGTPATKEQMAHDVVAFLTWAAEPKMMERKEAGIRNILMLVIFGVLVWYSNKMLWKPIKEGGDAA